jgi:uncharacterized protein (TIRG00374 family)
MTDDRRPPDPPRDHHHEDALYEAAEYLGAPADETIPEREVSLKARILNWRTIGSTVFALVLIGFLFRVVLNVDFASTLDYIANANPAMLAAAFVAYYLTFPLRSLRWTIILRKTGTVVPYRDATEILYLSWFVNCVVPAKLGDLYRAYLLRGNYDASISRTVGTIFIERITDVCVIFGLALAAGFWSFRGRERSDVDALFVAGFIFAALLVIVVVVLRFGGHRIARFLPGRVGEYYERFHHGSTAALTPGTLALVVAITIAVWTLEGIRVFFVIHSLGLAELDSLRISASIFVALAASLLTAIPLTPAGIGFVQFGIVWALSLYGVSAEAGTAVALTDFVVSTLSVIVIGGVLYLVSDKVRRAHRSRPAESPG